MPKVRFADLPRLVWQHLLDRVAGRKVSLADLHRLKDWVNTEPLVVAHSMQDDAIRIITARQATRGERKLYEED